MFTVTYHAGDVEQPDTNDAIVDEGDEVIFLISKRYTPHVAGDCFVDGEVEAFSHHSGQFRMCGREPLFVFAGTGMGVSRTHFPKLYLGLGDLRSVGHVWEVGSKICHEFTNAIIASNDMPRFHVMNRGFT